MNTKLSTIYSTKRVGKNAYQNLDMEINRNIINSKPEQIIRRNDLSVKIDKDRERKN